MNYDPSGCLSGDAKPGLVNWCSRGPFGSRVPKARKRRLETVQDAVLRPRVTTFGRMPVAAPAGCRGLCSVLF